MDQFPVQYMRELFSYIDRFRGAGFVVKIDDGLVGSELFPSLVQDLARIARVGIRLMIVAGARSRIDEVLARYGEETSMHGSVRVSPPQAMPLIEMAAFDVATKIMTRLTGQGIESVIGNWVRARTLGVVDGIDFLSTGAVDRIDLHHIERMTEEGIVPILPCIGWNRRGEPYNISSNQLAGTLARSARAMKLIYCRPEPAGLPARIVVDADAVRFVSGAGTTERTELEGPAEELVELAVAACRDGVSRVHIIDCSVDGILIEELFTNIGAGTMIHASGYDSVRRMDRSDIPEVMRIMKPYVVSGRLIPRSESDIEARAAELVVYDIDGTIHGVAGLTALDASAGEIYGVAVDPTAAELGVGGKLVSFLLDEAKANGMERVFVLTTQAYDWFQQLSFETARLEDLPHTRSYDTGRRSRILVRRLDRDGLPDRSSR